MILYPGVQILHGLRKISVGLFLDYKRIIFGLQKKTWIISWITKKVSNYFRITKKGVGLFSDYFLITKDYKKKMSGLFLDYKKSVRIILGLQKKVSDYFWITTDYFWITKKSVGLFFITVNGLGISAALTLTVDYVITLSRVDN